MTRRVSSGKRVAAALLAGALATLGFPIPTGERFTKSAEAFAFWSLSGQVLDAVTNAPLPNVTLRIVGTTLSTQTNSQGTFTFPTPPLGRQTLLLDARTTTVPGQWPIFPIPVTIQGATNNTFPTPIWIPELDEENGTRLTATNFNPTTGQTLQQITVQSPTAPGVRVTIPQGTYLRSAYTTLQIGSVLSVTRIPSNRPPMPLPNQSTVGMLVITQPGGLLFFDSGGRPVKVPMVFPNVQNEYTTGSRVQLFSALGGRLGTMVSGGTMTVQGGMILPDPGTGIDHFSCKWAPPGPPIPSLTTNENPQDLIEPAKGCEIEGIGSCVDPMRGNLQIDHPVTSHRSMGQTHQLRFVYNSSAAYPHPVITNNTSLPVGTPIPLATSAALSVNNAPPSSPIYWRGTDQPARQAMTFDATSLPTGRYPYTLTTTNHYQASNFSSTVSGNVLVHNQIASPFGAGWGLAGLQRLVLDAQGNALVSDGAGSMSFFGFGGTSGIAREDLVVANDFDNNVSILLGNGDGTFQPQQTVPVGWNPKAVAIGRFNQDAFEDLAVAHIGSLNVSILLGNGNGTFQPQQTFPVGSGASDVAIGHFNQDTFEDLAVAHYWSDNVSILLGNGNGTFQPPTTFPVGTYPISVAVGHFNQDAFEDLAVANNSSDNVSILLGNGDGTFQPQTTFPVWLSLSPDSIAVGHFNGDAFEDLAVANRTDIWGGPPNVSILLGNGDGTFQPQLTFPTGPNFSPLNPIAIGHFNGDAFEDLAVGDRSPLNPPPGTVSILLGNGDGTFQPYVTFPVGSVPQAVAIGHFNQDAFEDLAVVSAYSNDVSILLGNGNGTFQPQVTFPVGSWPQAVAVGNFNNDSLQPGFNSPPGDFSRLIRNPDATFTRTLKDGTKINFNQQGLHTSTVDRNGNATTYAYNPDGTLSTITDPTGFTYTFAYTGGRLSTITDSANRTTRVTINAISGDLTEILDPDGAKTTFIYDSPQITGPDHLMATRISPRGNDPTEPPPSQFTTTYTYDFAGQLVRTDRPGPNSTTITWRLLPSQANALVDPASGQGTPTNPAPLVLARNVTAQLTDPNGQLTRIKTDRFSAATQLTDPLGRITQIERNNFGQPTRIVRPNSAITKMTYDLKGNLLTLTEEGDNGPGSDDQTTIFTYEPIFNQVTTIKDPNNNINPATGVTTKIDYDTSGNPTRIIDALNTSTRLNYDEPGRGVSGIRGLLTSIIAAQGLPEANTTTFTYDPAARASLKKVTDPLNRITSFTYYSSGQIHTTTAEGNDNNPATDQLTTFTYDPMNRLRTVTDALTPPGLTQYTYDANGNLKTVTDANTPAGITTFRYDQLDRLQTTTDPLGVSETFAYELNGNLRTQVDRKTQTFTFSYDVANRLTQKEFPNPPPNPANTVVTFGYDNNQNSNLTDDNDNLALVVSPDARLRFIYDAFDRLSTAQTTGSPNQPDVRLSSTYDKNGNRTSLTAVHIPTSTTLASLTSTPDALNRLDLLTNTLTTQVVDFTHDVLSRRKQLDFPNATRTTLTYNLASEIDTLTHVFDPAGVNRLIARFRYTPDSLGNRRTLTETRPSFSITKGANTFGYDLLNRLLSATHPTPTPPAEAFTYDAVGNRLTAAGNPATWTYNRANRLTNDGRFTYTYDNNGNQLTKTEIANPSNVTTYGYTPENQLASSQQSAISSQYKYDGLGRRIQKSVTPTGGPTTTTRYLYDQEDILLEYNGTNVLKARWMQGPGIDDPLMMERDLNNNGTFEANERFTYHADGLGSITELTDSTGSTTRSYYYDAFGQLANQTGTLLNPYTYTAREYDPETGLLYYRARAYDPRIGRFLQEDPFKGIVETPKSQNLYPYALNNPTNLTDPSGTITTAGAIAAGIVSLGLFVAYISILLKRFAPEVRLQSRIRDLEGPQCPLEQYLEYKERFDENFTRVFGSGAPQLAVKGAGLTGTGTVRGQMLFLGKEAGSAIGEFIQNEPGQ